MWTSALCRLKKKEMRYLKAEKECKRKNERGNEQVSKKAKKRVWEKQKANIKDLKKKKRGNPNPRLAKT